MELVCTIGPKVKNYDDIKSYIASGMSIPRFNFSHADYKKFNMLLKDCKDIKFIMGDLQGNKLRVCKKFKGEVKVLRGYRVAFCLEKDFEDLCYSNNNYILIPVSYEGSFKDFKNVTHIYMKDATMKFKVLKIYKNYISAITIHGGIIRPEKGINAPMLNRSNLCLTEKDKKDIEWGIRRGINMIALSYTVSKENMIELRSYVNMVRKKYDIKEKVKLFAKIECREGYENFEEILEKSDGIILGRGDLKGEVKIEEIPRIEESIINRMKKSRKSLFIATYILDNMIRNREPSLGEINDIYTFIKNKAGGFILSTELTVSKKPEVIIRHLKKYMDIYSN